MNRLIYSMVATLFIMNSCKFPESGFKAIKIYNYSKDTIAYFSDERHYDPDYPSMFDDLPDSGMHFVPIKPNGGMFYDEIFFPDAFFNNYPDKKTKIYLFNLDTLNQYSLKEIKKSSNYLKRYDLSQHDMDSLNWTITYP